ncbi:MAG: hypothetical protein PVI86_03450 [Phycisphaerae bacterium]|jgi:hypothetical protein
MSGRRKQTKEKGDKPRTGQGTRPNAEPGDEDGDDSAALIRRHLWFGWRSLFFFLLLGLFLESLHGFKVGWYLDASDTTRRHMWTLAHAHGTLLAVLNLVFAGTLRLVPAWPQGRRALASACLLSAAIVLPTGFLLGGWFTYDGDPGIGILLVPIGAVLLLIAVFLAAALPVVARRDSKSGLRRGEVGNAAARE